MENFTLLYKLIQVTDLSWGWKALFFYGAIFIIFALISTFQMIVGTINVLLKFKEVAAEDIFRILRSNSLPQITFIIPAFNESKTIVYTAHNFLSLSYRYKQIIIINDGSTDTTLELLKTHFLLKPVPPSYPGTLRTQKIRSYYVSETHPELYVIDKDNGGKADALNAGLNACPTNIFVAADADTLLDDEALNRLIRPFLLDPITVVAHASVGVANGNKIERNRVVKFMFPKKLLAGLQALDFMKSFLIERMGLSWTKGALVVPGNFGLFKKDIILKLGGYDVTSMVEDTEIVTHMHQYLLSHKIKYKITYIPDLVAWTEAPETVKNLVKQRLRWYRGTTENLINYWYMCFNPKYRSIGLFVLPMTLFEKIAPLIELSGISFLFLAMLFSTVQLPLVLALAIISWGFGILQIFFTLVIEYIAYQTYSSWKDLAHIAKCTFCYVGYHYILLYCRLKGLYAPKVQRVGWVPIREGYDKIKG